MSASPLGFTQDTTIIDAIRTLAAECDGARARDKKGFSKYDRLKYRKIIDRAIEAADLTPKEEDTAYRMLKKYSKQLAALGIEYSDITMIPRAGGGEEDSEAGSARLVKIALSGANELWHTEDKEAFISITVDGHVENRPLRERAVKNWLSSMFYRQEKAVPSSQAIQDAIAALEGIAVYDGEEYPVFTRVRSLEGKVYVDLGNEMWDAIEIDADGWRIVTDVPIHFRRSKNMLPMADPEPGGNWDDLRKMMNAQGDRTWVLSIAWGVQAFWVKGPFAHLNFNGEQGSGKTMAQILLKDTLDPSVTQLRRPPKDERDLMIAARNERIPSFDNLSGMPENLSDAFCGLSTGIALATRQLYTDGEEAIFAARRPCLMNGIDSLTNRGDLLDRTLIVELPHIDKGQRKMERKIMADYREIRGKVLGLFLDATVTGLKNIGTENGLTDLPRMADFTDWVTACEPSLPWKAGLFLEEYRKSIKDNLSSLVDSDPIAKVIYDMAMEYGSGTNRETHIGRSIDHELVAESKEANPDDIVYLGTASDLLEHINQRRDIDENRVPKGWPRTPNTLSSRLRRAAPALAARGVDMDMYTYRNIKVIEIRVQPEERPSATQQPTVELVKVRFLVDYRSQYASPENAARFIDRLFLRGEIVDLPKIRVEELIRRGIVEAVVA